MIDSTKERLLSLERAAELVAEAHGRERTSTKTLYRWSSRGLRGVVLETVQAGGKKATTLEAIDRFFRALTPEPSQPESQAESRPVSGPPRGSRQRAAGPRSERASAGDAGQPRGHASASETLDRLGL